MKGIVWYKDKVQGLEKMKEIQQQYEKLRVETYVTDGGFMIHCENGDYWKGCPARDAARGNKCNVSYIQRGIPEDVISTIIYPCTIALPYQAFRYWGDEEYEL